ncbi:MAG: class beta-lactamase-related serine hydrolase [Chitinophagaceae bacterium]|nr:class beta-lactamase-related serine hydrolase [Chitinophagaceae bacterium]
MIKSTFSFLLFLSLLAAAQPSPSVLKSLDSLFAATFKPGEPGGSVLIAKAGHVIYKKGFGVEDIQTKKPITTESLFNTGSISKTFVAFAILRLADEGKLSLTDNLYKYFPDFHNIAIAKKIRIYNLLTHTSGLPDNRKIVEDSVFYLTAKDEENFASIKQTDKLNFEPGERFEYSNPAFNGLALIIEKVTGLKWQDYVKTIIFKPAAMKSSDITDGSHPQSGVAHGYLKNGNDFFEKDYGEEPTFAAAGNGGVWSSVEELWKYEQAIQKNIFLPKNIIKKSRTVYSLPNWKAAEPPFIGLCWFLMKENGVNLAGHTGSQGGFRGDYQWLPEKKIFFVVLCNTPLPMEGLRKKSLDILQRYNWLN